MSEKLELRSLQVDDMFLLSAIFDKMEISIDIGALDVSDDESRIQAGMKLLGPLLMQALRKLHKARAEVVELLSSLSGKSKEEVGKLSPGAFIGAVREIMSQEGVIDFLSSQKDLT